MSSRIHYFIFDLLVLKDRDLTRLPLVERSKILKSLKLGSESIRISEEFHTVSDRRLLSRQ